MTTILEGRGLTKRYPVGRSRSLTAVDGVDLTLEAGETLAIVGESGSGKSTLGRLLLLVEAPDEGSVLVDGVPVAGLSKSELRALRPQIQAVFQDPFSSLSPRMRIAEIVAEPIRASGRQVDRSIVADLLEQVGLDPPTYLGRYPHECSGGQLQRVAIARALATRPRILVLDEPVSSLDVSIRASIMRLLADLKVEHGLSYVLISHDLPGVAYLADRIAVMYLGRVVEVSERSTVLRNARHPYARALWSTAMPLPPGDPGPPPLVGEMPSPIDRPDGCAFAPRCEHAFQRCLTEDPALQEVEGSFVACHLYPTPGLPVTDAVAQWSAEPRLRVGGGNDQHSQSGDTERKEGINQW